MVIKTLKNNPVFKEIYLIIFFGVLSYGFNKIRFFVPGLEGVTTDLKEIPLIISIFYVSNPLSLVLIYLITAIDYMTAGNFWPTFITHSASLIIIWYLYKFIKGQKLSTLVLAIFWFFLIGIYYTLFLIPIFIFTNYLLDLNTDVNFMTFYGNIFKSALLEIMTTALITSLFYIQYKTRNELKKHKDELEIIVRERTDELLTTNEELQATNDELYSKNTIINEQNAELKTTMQHLEDAQAQLIETEKNASLGLLTSGVSHEINNPLNYINGGYIALTNYFKENDPDNQQVSFLLNSIKTGIDRVSKIVKGLNEFSREDESSLEDTEIHYILENCLTMLHNQFMHRIKINKQYYKDKLIVWGNIGKLHQVFINILNNAIQAIDQFGEITIITDKRGNEVHVLITDTGHGICKEDIPRITDPFFTTKDPGKGTGLGLSIANKIITEHDGKLDCESEISKGTTIKISLPQKFAKNN
jgi:signal transduction histidine kinase